MMRLQDRHILAMVGTFVTLWGTEGILAQTKTIDLRDPGFVEFGAPLFAKNCAVGYCHGSEGVAGRGPRLSGRHWNSSTLFEVIQDGIQGTAMPGWDTVLSREEIWAITAYVISLGTGEFVPVSGKLEIGEQVAMDELSVEARKGRKLFFDLTNEKRCAVCHRIGSQGSVIGPELASVASKKSEKELSRDITDPGAAIARGFEQTIVITTDGRRASGIEKDRNGERVQIYDATAAPPPLRTFYKDQIESVSNSAVSSMPTGYGDMYSSSELSEIIAFLKSGG